MKKSILLLIIFLLFLPFVVFADDAKKTCVYENNRIKVYVDLYEGGKTKKSATLKKDNTDVGTYYSDVFKSSDWSDVNTCPKYVLITYSASTKKAFISNVKEDLEKKASDEAYKLINFEDYDSTSLYENFVNGRDVAAQILEVTNEAVETEGDTLSCPYTSIEGCENCSLTINYFKSKTSYKVGESVVSNYTKTGGISTVEFVGDGWTKEEMNTSLKQEVVPFSSYLPKNLCPTELVFQYNSENKSLKVYANAIREEQEAGKNGDFDIEFDDPYKDIGSNNVNCDTLGTLRKDLNSVFNIIKIVAPILIIVFSIYDFIKAAAGKVEGEMKKAFSKLLKRIIFAVILFFLPTILDYFLGLVNPGYTTCINS